MWINGESEWIGGVETSEPPVYAYYRASTFACAVMESMMFASIIAILFGGGFSATEVTWG